MDPLSHAVLGASCAQSASRAGTVAVAGGLACVSAMAPDLDTLIRSPTDPLFFLEYHRHFTHALLFVPAGALLCAGLFYPSVRTRVTFPQTFLFCLLGYGSHGLLDACTTFGTQLFWPFSGMRVAWSNIAVFDPLFTVPVLALVAAAGLLRRRRYARFALLWALAYLSLGFVQRERATAAGERIAAARGHEPVRIEATPSLGSLLLWKTIYECEGRYYVDGVRLGLAPMTYPGENIQKLDVTRDLPWLERDSQQARDLERFRRISNDLLAPKKGAPGQVIELRYSMVPNHIDSFWAIVLDPDAAPTDHVRFIATRESAPQQALRLLDMIF